MSPVDFFTFLSNEFADCLSHQAKVINSKCLIQGRKNVTRVGDKLRSIDQGRWKKDAFAFLVTPHAMQLLGRDSYQKIRELSSSNGRLDLTLSVEMASFQFDWLTVQRRTYNGSTENVISGPTWRVRQGDFITVTLVRITTGFRYLNG